VAVEEKLVLVVVGVQRKHPVVGSGKSIRIIGQIVKSYEAAVDIIAATTRSKVLEVKCRSDLNQYLTGY
jgi:hypothetical protein